MHKMIKALAKLQGNKIKLTEKEKPGKTKTKVKMKPDKK